MPANPRQTAKRELDRSVNNMDMALKHIGGVAETYRADHPEISDQLDIIAYGLITAQDAIKEVNSTI